MKQGRSDHTLYFCLSTLSQQLTRQSRSCPKDSRTWQSARLVDVSSSLFCVFSLSSLYLISLKVQMKGLRVFLHILYLTLCATLICCSCSLIANTLRWSARFMARLQQYSYSTQLLFKYRKTGCLCTVSRICNSSVCIMPLHLHSISQVYKISSFSVLSSMWGSISGCRQTLLSLLWRVVLPRWRKSALPLMRSCRGTPAERAKVAWVQVEGLRPSTGNSRCIISLLNSREGEYRCKLAVKYPGTSTTEGLAMLSLPIFCNCHSSSVLAISRMTGKCVLMLDRLCSPTIKLSSQAFNLVLLQQASFSICMNTITTSTWLPWLMQYYLQGLMSLLMTCARVRWFSLPNPHKQLSTLNRYQVVLVPDQQQAQVWPAGRCYCSTVLNTRRKKSRQDCRRGSCRS